MKNTSTTLLAGLALLMCVAGCSRFSTRSNVDLFEGTQAIDAVAKIKKKIGADKVNVISVELSKHQLKMTIQAPDNPKNIDAYTFEDKGSKTFGDFSVSGPTPVKTVEFGKTEMTADKYQSTDLDEIDFAAIPAVAKNAIALSQLENGVVDLISMDLQSAERTDPSIKANRDRDKEALDKELEENRVDCQKNIATDRGCTDRLDELMAKEVKMAMSGIGGPKSPLVFTMRIFVEGPRGRKDFWADKKGNINEKPF